MNKKLSLIVALLAVSGVNAMYQQPLEITPALHKGMVPLSESAPLNEKGVPIMAIVKQLAQTPAVSDGLSQGLYVGWTCFKFEAAQKGLSIGLELLSDKLLLKAFIEAGAEGMKYGLMTFGCVVLVEMMLDHYRASSN